MKVFFAYVILIGLVWLTMFRGDRKGVHEQYAVYGKAHETFSVSDFMTNRTRRD